MLSQTTNTREKSVALLPEEKKFILSGRQNPWHYVNINSKLIRDKKSLGWGLASLPWSHYPKWGKKDVIHHFKTK